jgi:hypothetical protein
MKAFFLLFIGVFLSGCVAAPVKRDYPVTHIVLVWFNEVAGDNYADTVSAATMRLLEIPEVGIIRTGRAISSERPIVDDSFDLGVVMEFESMEAMKLYLEHPLHKQFVEGYLTGRIEKLLVYDF